MFVAAVFDIVSDSTTVNRAAAKVSVASSFVGTSPVMPSPTTCARPVDAASPPRASPPPNSRMVPQSIWAACFQVMVVRSVALFGSRNSSTTPASAATASGTLSSTETATDDRCPARGPADRAPPTGRR